MMSRDLESLTSQGRSSDLAETHRNRPPPGGGPDGREPNRALDWFVFFVADIQTGFGPFVAVFLTSQKWTQVDIGLVLTVSGVVSLVGQIPLGALVDSVRSIRTVAAISLALIGLSALAFATWPVFVVVFATRILHAAASCVLGFSLVSLSLGLVGPDKVSERLGRNAAYASAGTGIAAAIMGLCGKYVSDQAVFFLAAALVPPAILALSCIRADTPLRATRMGSSSPRIGLAALAQLTRNRALIIFAFCIGLFHLANAAMLPLAASMVTLRSREAATIMVAASMIVPQFTVTLLSPIVGRAAERWGRRPFLILGFVALIARGWLLSITEQTYLIVFFQVLDGVSAAVLGVLVPLTVADLSGGSRYFNLAQGSIGCAMGIGAAISTTLTGYLADTYGSYTAFTTLAILATVGLSAVVVAMPETKPSRAAAWDPT
jgi:MFS family permease